MKTSTPYTIAAETHDYSVVNAVMHLAIVVTRIFLASTVPSVMAV